VREQGGLKASTGGVGRTRRLVRGRHKSGSAGWSSCVSDGAVAERKRKAASR
jgi:hypothetical protein